MRLALFLVGLTALSGCASIIDGSQQSLAVKTTGSGTDVANSQCTLTNNKGTWYTATPNSVAVHRSYDDLTVKCTHDGYIANSSAATSHTKGLVFGNILFGGLIGAAVDMGTGAAYDYPGTIVIDLQPAKAAKADSPPTS